VRQVQGSEGTVDFPLVAMDGVPAYRHPRYHHEQGLSQKRLTCEDIFAPELLET
jgi:hypothetical protein